MLRARNALPSPAMVVALVALVFALGGTGYAASTIASDSAAKHKPKQPSDTRADTTLFSQLAKNASVLNAKFAGAATTAASATNATNATNAVNATSATNATNAANASNLGGQPAASYLAASRVGTNGIVKASGTAGGNTVTLFTSGPFTVTMTCTKSGGNVTAAVNASSSEGSSVLWGSLAATAGTNTPLVSSGPSTGFAANAGNVVDLEAPSGANVWFDAAVGVISLGADCWANLHGWH